MVELINTASFGGLKSIYFVQWYYYSGFVDNFKPYYIGLQQMNVSVRKRYQHLI